jgi:hypothetical protein
MFGNPIHLQLIDNFEIYTQTVRRCSSFVTHTMFTSISTTSRQPIRRCIVLVWALTTLAYKSSTNLFNSAT